MRGIWFAGRDRGRRRRGFGLPEMAIAGLLLTTMVLITLQLVGWVARDRQTIGRREAATRLVAGVLERSLAHPWPEITTEALAPLVESANRDRPAAAGELAVEVVAVEPVAGHRQKKINLTVSWPVESGIGAPVRLVAWTIEPTRGNQP